MCCHLPRPESVTPSTTQASSPSLWCRSHAHNNVILPKPVTLCTLRHSWARDAVYLRRPWAAAPSSSPCPQRHHPRDVPELVTPSNPHRPWARKAIVLPKPAMLHCIFFFVILGLQILIFICYIATLLRYATLLLCCCIALICYIATLLWYITLPLICRIALICYIAFDMLHIFDMLHCHITLICYIAFVLLHCFDMLYCFCSATLWSIWMHTTLLNNKSRLSEMSVAT
jgi:hypothetical protein